MMFLYIHCSWEGQRLPFAVIGVIGVAIDKLQRMSVRKTWARKAGSFDICVFFHDWTSQFSRTCGLVAGNNTKQNT